MSHPVQPRSVPFAVAREEHDALRTILSFNFVEVLSDHADGLIPADRLEFAFAPCADALQRSFDPVFPVNIAFTGLALYADFSFVPRMGIHAFDLDDPAVFNIAVDAAVHTGTADGAHGVLHFDPCIFSRNLGF